MFSEVTEVRDAIHLLTPRAVNEEVGKRLLEEMEWYDNYLNMGKTDRSANPSPGNKKGGLANVVEKDHSAPLLNRVKAQLLKCCRPVNARLNAD